MKAVVLWCFAMLVGSVVALILTDGALRKAGRERDAAKAAEQIALARYAEVATQSEAVRDTVIREVTKTRTLRDSVLLLKTDTLAVERFVLQVDTLVVACERCAASLLALRVASDSLLHAKDLRIASLTPSRWDRVKPYLIGAGAFWLGTKFSR